VIKKTVLFILLISVFFQTVHAEMSQPVLRLSTDMHMAKVVRISTDADGRYLLTASKDKTAKLWDAESGDLIKTFRPPVKKGNEGMLYACALSPDGQVAALGGWTVGDAIFFYRTDTGELFQQFKAPGGVTRDLEFSPDGKYLVAAFSDSYGADIYKSDNRSLSSFTKYKTLTGYGNDCYNVAFAPDNRMATVSFDGNLRLYNSLFELVKKTTASETEPFAISFSPDGSLLAVGYKESPIIEVRSAYNLGLEYKPELGDMNVNGGLSSVCFSADGNYLYGGGSYFQKIDGSWWCVLRRWNRAGRGSYTDTQGCKNIITDIRAVSGRSSVDAGVFIGGSHPDWGRIEAAGRQKIYREGELYSFRNSQFKYLKINASGDEITFKPIDKPGLAFSLPKRAVTASGTLKGVSAYTDKKNGIAISNWEDTHDPLFNGKKIDFLRQYERSRSVDIAAGSRVVLGADWSIYGLSSQGKKLWETPVLGVAWAVNISGNGKVVAAANGDGVINWYRMTDGGLLLTLYVHPETKKWVLFTQNGYYDASPGAENYFGWHINGDEGGDSLFFPSSKFRNKYYRPDVIDNILITLNEDKAVQIADMAGSRKKNTEKIENILPPVVRIIKPDYNQEVKTDTVTIEYTAKSPGGESVNNVKFMIDGRPVENQRAIKLKGPRNSARKTITIPKRDVIIQVLAQNRHGWSEPAEVRVKWAGRSVAPSDLLKPSLYVLAVGVSDYKNNDYDLRFAAKDARDFTTTIKRQKGGLYKDVVVKTLTDADAVKNNILDGLDWIQKETTARDMAMIFIAGHGVNDNLGTFYYLPHEADTEKLRRTGIMFTELKYTASAIAGKVILFVDACHSGNVMGGRRSTPDVTGLVNELSDVENGAVVFTSSTGRQFSLEDESWGNGAFTRALNEGLSGKADLFGKGKITIKALDAYIADRVKVLTGGKQSPTVVIPRSMPDFPIGVVK